MKNYNNFITEKTEIFRKISKYYANLLDVEIVSLFDSGLNGAAYLTSKNTVIKITPSYNEANAVYKLINKQKTKNLKHIAEYYDIKQISLNNEIYYAIHLELLKLDCNIYVLYREYLKLIDEHNKIFNNYLSHYKSKHIKILYQEIRDRINPKLRKFILQLIELIEELENINIENEDLHAGNLGYKNDNLAIFDILTSDEINYLPYNKCEKIYEENTILDNHKLFEYINNKKLVKTTINNTLKKITKIIGGSINFNQHRSDKLILNISFDADNEFEKKIINELEKLKKQLLKSGTYLTYKSHLNNHFIFDDSGDFDLKIDYTKPPYLKFHLFVKDTYFNRIKPPRYLYHATKHSNYDNIIKNGLVIRPNTNYKTSNDLDRPDAIFAGVAKDTWDKNNIADIWRIDTTKIKNKWYLDYNLYFNDNESFLTYESIPPEAIKFIKK
jgi:hypothetical protein